MSSTNACVYERQDSPFWWIKFWCTERVNWRRKSSGFRRDDPLGERRARIAAGELGAQANGMREIAASTRWNTWVESWLRDRHRNSPRSLSAELGRWHWVDLFLSQRRVSGPEGVTYKLALAYMTWRKSQVKRSKKSPCHNTALQEVRLLSRVMTEAVHLGFIHANPLHALGIKRDPVPEKPELTDSDIATIRAALEQKEGHLPIQDQWMTVCFEIGLLQGCRLRETSLLLTDVDENGGRIIFHAKRHKVFTSLLHPDLVPLIRRLRTAGAERTCVLPRMASKEWHWFFKGRPERGKKGVCPHVCFHCTRVTAITRMARNNVPIAQAMAYVGHADQTIHRVYQRLQANDLSLCVGALRFAPNSEMRQIPGAGETMLGAKRVS